MLSDDQIKAVPPTVKAKALALAQAYASGEDTVPAKDALYFQARAVFTDINPKGKHSLPIPEELAFFSPIANDGTAPRCWAIPDADNSSYTKSDTLYGSDAHLARVESQEKLHAFLNEYVGHLANEHGLTLPENGEYYTGQLNVTLIMSQKAKRLAELMDPAASANVLGDQFQQQEIGAVQKALYFYARVANGELFIGHLGKQDGEKTLKALLNEYVVQVAKNNDLQVPANTPYLPAGATLHVA